MRCPSCTADNPDAARRCRACGTRIPRRRDQADEFETPFAPLAAARHPLAVVAYRCGVFGLIPFAGLLLGPAALVLGAIAWLRERRNPALRFGHHAVAAILLGGVLALTNWGGLALIVYGLSGGG